VYVFLLLLPPSFVVSPPLSLCPLFQGGYTALMRASRNGHARVVKLLLAARANTDLKDKVSPPPPQREN
jgi:ankyrin repeat protein